jgi:L-seryl-tRNA(Ser) seleniumtransferase
LRFERIHCTGEGLSSTGLRAIPSVERVVQALGAAGLPRRAAVAVVRRELAAFRTGQVPEFDGIVGTVRAAIERLRSSRIAPVVNGTGILVHTNLGRAPLAPAAIAALTAAGANYSNIEYDLAAGRRGARASYLEHNLALLCGAPAAMAVNNCAAALVLMLRHFTRTKREVIISRGELIEIGGGFRIPEILEASGARLREVGTTNKTALADYADAIGPDTALVLKVHRSNFYLEGFTASVEMPELAGLARARRIPLAEDLGSGALIATDTLAALEHERTPAEALKDGADLVCFSGDKLMGGPQAGLIAGRAKMVAALKREPFFRALRCDKLILSALEATVDLYLGGEEEIPVLQMLRCPLGELRDRAEKLASALADLPLDATVGAGRSEIGGGTLPRSSLDSVTLDLAPRGIGITELASRLRAATPPVIGYIAANRLKLDLRTIFPRQDEAILLALRSVVCER